MSDDIQRESMEYDVIIVGAGPAGLAASIRLKQLAAEAGAEISVAVLEKGAEVGAHILSGVVVDPKALNELIPDWKEQGCPLTTEVKDDIFLALSEHSSFRFPNFAFPPFMTNHGCYTGSLGAVCKWLGERAEALGVEIYPGFPAANFIEEDGVVKGVVTGDFGVARDGSHKDGYQPGMELRGKYTLIGEGARGSVAKKLMDRFNLGEGRDPQKFGIGLKELWRVKPEKHKPGTVQHTMGWPLDNNTGGGSFLYHWGDNLVSVGFVVHLNYKNPWISPFEEFQRMKTHPEIRDLFEGAERLEYGARAITEGGFQSVPKLAFPGGALIGCSAGFVNVPRIKGSHNAMKTGMLAAESVFAAVQSGRQGDELSEYQTAYENSWVAKDLKLVRNVKPLWSKFGTFLGIMLGGMDMWMNYILGGFSLFGTMKHGKSDAASLEPADKYKKIDYPKPDGVLTFDRLSSVFISNTNHEEDQPIHLKLADPALQKSSEWEVFAGPSSRYCPAGVYEWVEDENSGERNFVINAQNCVHCKTCDIKDPNQNIDWTTPEGGQGPIYSNM
ncbi:electron transfer flavoprotein-ubiquinone oxidoreductase [Hyphobacterium sp. HN65]|uniref:Electron transfer flavoprotein-ubiquinone oxidoreductase n=1 Tax=Hyphobacterium lacteum TaxID=3116575 RepID=A0ABU7LMZ7_9PROT|nr:electron transfer flavoprotein-ubiquinone oxidoreductase [Hyphobacterium sp. HN65]MEE2525272.1 electron transfer flavoprotein-ubiquinone oxidoreductase [Hyphobacterium sp. HN65]